MNTSLRLKVSLAVLTVIAALLAFIVVKNLAATHQSLKSFDPKDYGISRLLGGYEVMAVVPSENMACALPGRINLILRAIPNQQQTLTQNDLSQIANNVHAKVEITITSGIVTIDAVKNQVESWNKDMRPDDCAPLGYDIQSLIPPSQLRGSS